MHCRASQSIRPDLHKGKTRQSDTNPESFDAPHARTVGPPKASGPTYVKANESFGIGDEPGDALRLQPEVDEFDADGECHREIDVAFVHMLAHPLGDQQRADQD